MKRRQLIFLAALFLFSLNKIISQQIKSGDVPKSVLSSFEKKFGKSKVEKWIRESNGTYKAKFDLDKTETKACFNIDGELVETETEIKINELPVAIKEYISKNYPAYKIHEAGTIKHASGSLFFETVLQKGKEWKELIFTDKSIFVKEKVEEAGEDPSKE
jgi:hypothetical protein